MDKQPFTHASARIASECTGSQVADTATTASGNHYDITGPLKDVIIADFEHLQEPEFEAKWVSVLRTPESIAALGIEA